MTNFDSLSEPLTLIPSTTPSATFWAIADTHLSSAKPLDMARFGENWVNHVERLALAWRERISPEDIVLLAGDISWAQSPSRVWGDLQWLQSLPGRKVLLRGNHDHWWKSIDKVRAMLTPMGLYAIEGDSLVFEDVIVCGAMGHMAPEDQFYRPDPPKNRYTRELHRLECALRHAMENRTANQPVILMLHYPPFTSDGKRTAYVDVISHYRPDVCIYGHLHRSPEWDVATCGEFEGVRYQLVASDYLNMVPLPVWPLSKRG